MRRLLYLMALSMLVVAMTSNAATAQDDLNCDDFDSQAEAQQTLRQDPSDPNGLDAESDGVACETEDYDNPARDETPVTAAQEPGGDLDCEDFATQEQAQATFNQDTSDPNNLDADNDGLACEDSLPSEGASDEGMADEDMNDNGMADDSSATIAPAAEDQYVDDDQYAGDDQYADADDEMIELPDTGGPVVLPFLGAFALIGVGGLLLRRSLN